VGSVATNVISLIAGTIIAEGWNIVSKLDRNMMYSKFQQMNKTSQYLHVYITFSNTSMVIARQFFLVTKSNPVWCPFDNTAGRWYTDQAVLAKIS